MGALRTTTTDVLIVGAGPTGLALAAELRRHGRSCRVIEQLEEPVIYSKAAVVHARTMEVFESMGVVEEILARCRKLHGFNLYAAERRVAHVSFEGMDSPYPYLFGVSQRDTELVLTKHLQKLGGDIARGAKLEAFTQDDDGVTAEIAVAGGIREAVRARYIVGADGAHSRVREVLGIAFEGTSYEERLIQADLRIEWPSKIDDDEVVAFLNSGGPLACFPLFNDGRYRLIAMLEPGVELEPTLENFQTLMSARGIAGAKLSDPAWTVGFRIHCRMVPRYRDRRAFLAGDAAHIHSPAGGQGMNTGIQDAYNLAWKLALALEGRAKPELLDSYQAERLPIARATLDATDLATRHGTAVLTLRHPVATELRNQLIGFVSGLEIIRERLAQNVSMLAINYRGSPIVSQDQPSILGLSILSTEPQQEQPTLLDWMNFGQGPTPGDRVGDVVLSGERRLFELLRGTKHTLLLFDGGAATQEGYENLSRIGGLMRDRYGAEVQVHVVLPAGRATGGTPEHLTWDGSVVNDEDGALHKRFGARSECLYLIRPDGYVAYRSQPANGERLEAYLTTLFSPRGPPR